MIGKRARLECIDTYRLKVPIANELVSKVCMYVLRVCYTIDVRHRIAFECKALYRNWMLKLKVSQLYKIRKLYRHMIIRSNMFMRYTFRVGNDW